MDRRLSFLDALLLVMGGVIGVGIFFTPQSVAALVPETGPYLLLWALGGLVGIVGALTFAELAGSFPRAGGWYVFLRQAWGPFVAFLFAWIVLLVVSTGASAVIAGFCARQVVTVFPALAGSETAIGLAILLAVTGVALAGVKRAALLQDVCTLLKLSALLALVGAGLLFGEPAREAAPAAEATPRGFVLAILPVLFSYGGWHFVTYLAPSVKEPQRTLPRAIVLGMLGVTAVYLLVNLAFVRVLGLDVMAAEPGFAALAATRSLGSVGGTLIVVAMAISSLGVCTAILLSSPWVPVAMAEEGLFFKAFGKLSPRTGAPVLALLVQGVVACAYFLWGKAGVLTDAVVFSEWIFHCLCGLALLRLRRTRPDLPRPFRSPGYPFVPALYSLLAAAVVVGAIWQAERAKTLLGLGVLAAGALVYPLWRRLFSAQSAA